MIDKKITLVIPTVSKLNNLIVLFDAILQMTLLPGYIILINSNKIKNIELIIKKKLNLKKIKLKVFNVHNYYPGAARNLGILNANTDLIAFLDVETLPKKNWLKNIRNTFYKKKLDIIFGKTFYVAKNYNEKIIRASTYGNQKIKTIPGSLIKKNVFHNVGFFLEALRAGEDGDWMFRVKKFHNFKTLSSNSTLNYIGLKDLNYSAIMKKWFRNYKSSGGLPHLQMHRTIYYFLFSFILVLCAYHYNRSFDGWIENPLYIPHITKIIVSILLFFYIFTRGIFIPLRKKTKLKFLFPANFLFVSIFSLSLDIIKLFSFVINNINFFKKIKIKK